MRSVKLRASQVLSTTTPEYSKKLWFEQKNSKIFPLRGLETTKKKKKTTKKKTTNKTNTPKKEEIVARCLSDIIDCMIKVLEKFKPYKK